MNKVSVKAKVSSKPIMVSPSEIRAHELIRQPYRNWCRYCVMGKASDVKHNRGKVISLYPVLSVDSTYMAQSENASPILVAHDNKIECIRAWVVPFKGGRIGVFHRVCHWLNYFGQNKVILKADQGPAIIDLQKAIEDERAKAIEETMTHTHSTRNMEHEMETGPFSIVLDKSPVGESQANGAVGNAIRRIQGEVRTVKLATEDALKAQIATNLPIWQWLVE